MLEQAFGAWSRWTLDELIQNIYRYINSFCVSSTDDASLLLENWSVPCAWGHTIATIATDKKLGFLDDLRVTWLSFHPDITFAQNPRKDQCHKTYSVFNLEAHIFGNYLFLSDYWRRQQYDQCGDCFACSQHAQIVYRISHTHPRIRQPVFQFYDFPADRIICLDGYSAHSGVSRTWSYSEKLCLDSVVGFL